MTSCPNCSRYGLDECHCAGAQGSKPDQEIYATYIGGGGQIKIEAQTTASAEQLRRARDFIDLLINSAGR